MLTDGEGHFEFAVPTAASEPETGMSFSDSASQVWRGGFARAPLWLIAQKPGFLDDPDERPVNASREGETIIALIPEGLIKGRVSLAGSEGGGVVTVQLLSRQVQDGMPRWEQANSARANSNGEFRFSELLPGTYKLVTDELMDNDPADTPPGGQLYGFPPVYYPGVADFAAAGTIQLAAGQTVEADLSLTRQPYYPVKIPVPMGEGNGGMNVNVSVLGHRGPGYSLGYNPSTQRIEGLLPNGNYVVEATGFGYNPSTQRIEGVGPQGNYGGGTTGYIQDSWIGVVNLKVAGGPAEGSTMTTIRSGSLAVDVKEEFSDTTWTGSGSWSDGKKTFTIHGPRSYLQVRVETADDFDQPRNARLRPPTGPNDDSLVLENVLPGRYWLRLSSGRGYIASATMGGVDLLHEPLTVGAGGTTPIEIKVRDDSASLDGTVAGQAMQGATIAGNARYSQPQAWVYLIPSEDGPGQFQQLAVADDGKFSNPTIAPGSYRVLAFKSRQPNLPYRDPEAMKAYETKGQVIHLAAGEKTTVQVQIIPGKE